MLLHPDWLPCPIEPYHTYHVFPEPAGWLFDTYRHTRHLISGWAGWAGCRACTLHSAFCILQSAFCIASTCLQEPSAAHPSSNHLSILAWRPRQSPAWLLSLPLPIAPQPHRTTLHCTAHITPLKLQSSHTKPSSADCSTAQP